MTPLWKTPYALVIAAIITYGCDVDLGEEFDGQVSDDDSGISTSKSEASSVEDAQGSLVSDASGFEDAYTTDASVMMDASAMMDAFADGGQPPIASEGCPGEPIPLGAGEKRTILGTTIGFRDDIVPYCTEYVSGSPDAVYQILPDVDGTLTLTLSPVTEGMNPVLYVQRGQCDSIDRTVACERSREVYETTDEQINTTFDMRQEGSAADSEESPSGDATIDGAEIVDGGDDSNQEDGSVGVPLLKARVVVEAQAGIALHAIVDSAADPGQFSLVAQLEPAACGDGAINTNNYEECDFGNDRPNDGCSSTCTFDPPGRDDTCGLDNINSIGSEPIEISSYTTGYTDDYTSPCTTFADEAPDRVTGFFTTQAGFLTATVTAEFDVVLYAHDECPEGNLSGVLSCADGDRRDTSETISFPIAANSTKYIVVDGFEKNAWGRYTLRVAFTAAL